MKPWENWGRVPALQVDDHEIIENEDKAQAFLDSFFPSKNHIPSIGITAQELTEYFDYGEQKPLNQRTSGP